MAFRILTVNKLHSALSNNKFDNTLLKVRTTGGLGHQLFSSADIIILHGETGVDHDKRPADDLVVNYEHFGVGTEGTRKTKTVMSVKKDLEQLLFHQIEQKQWSTTDICNSVTITLPNRKTPVRIGSFTSTTPMIMYNDHEPTISPRYSQVFSRTLFADPKCDVVVGFSDEIRIAARKGTGEDSFRAKAFAEYMMRKDYFIPHYEDHSFKELIFIQNSAKNLQPYVTNHWIQISREEMLHCSLIKFIGIQGANALLY